MSHRDPVAGEVFDLDRREAIEVAGRTVEADPAPDYVRWLRMSNMPIADLIELLDLDTSQSPDEVRKCYPDGPLRELLTELNDPDSWTYTALIHILKLPPELRRRLLAQLGEESASLTMRHADCPVCGNGIITEHKGRPRKYCSRAHRQKAYRQRTKN